MRRRRRRNELEVRFADLAQRLADVEDTVDLSLGADLVDDLAHRVGELSLTVPTQEDLLDLRLATARVATELARTAAELQASVDRLSAATTEGLGTLEAQIDSLRAAVHELAEDGHPEQRTVLRRA